MQSVNGIIFKPLCKVYRDASNFYCNQPFIWCYLFFKNISSHMLEPRNGKECCKLLRVLSVSRIGCWIFYNLYIPSCAGKNLKLWCSNLWKMHWIYVLLLIPQFPVHKFRRNFLKICLPEAERFGENYDLLYQNSVRKYKGDLEH